MKALPKIMVAPNGARRTKVDHPSLPVTISELVKTGSECFEAGAGAMHAHVRDEDQMHVLDAGLYKELIAEMAIKVPGIEIQITTEAIGRYSPDEQRKLVYDVSPKAVSVSLTEMFADGNMQAAKAFYAWCLEAGIAVQHILYSTTELQRFIGLSSEGLFQTRIPQLLFVLGRYTEHQQSDPMELMPFVGMLNTENLEADWAVCAFGKAETHCAKKAFELGGKCRVGFENSFWNADGSVASNNAERVAEIFQTAG